MIPDIENLVTAYLRDTPAVAALVADRVETETPNSTTEPWVRVVAIDDPPSGKSTADHLIAFYLQIDCFAGKKGTRGLASRIRRTVRAAMTEIELGDHQGAVVTGARAEGGQHFLDKDFDKPMHRYMLTATVWAHGAEEGS